MLLYLLAGAALLWVGYRIYRRTPGVQRGRWRVGSGLLASVLLAVSGFLAVRGLQVPALATLVAALVLAGITRSRREGGTARPPPTQRREPLTEAEARAILGVDASAGPDEIRAAYTRLMRMAHPDKGGTAGLAAQLNAARDRLLER